MKERSKKPEFPVGDDGANIYDDQMECSGEVVLTNAL